MKKKKMQQEILYSAQPKSKLSLGWVGINLNIHTCPGRVLSSHIEKVVNCMIDCVQANIFSKVVFQTMKFLVFHLLQLGLLRAFLGPVNLFLGLWSNF